MVSLPVSDSAPSVQDHFGYRFVELVVTSISAAGRSLN
jgi:hypothetical protein